MSKIRLFVSACEPSSNLHLSKLLPLLFERFSQNLEVYGIFDEALSTQFPMQKPLWGLKDFAIMGLFDVLGKVFFYKKAITKCSEVAAQCDVALLMDSSSFNLPIANNLKKSHARTKVVYYILPQVWAWKSWRAKNIERVCDVLCGILPFEAMMYPNAVRKGRFHYVGHPLLDEIQAYTTKLDSKNVHNQAKKESKATHQACLKDTASPLHTPTLAFMPGSRKGEIKRIFPIFAKAAQELIGRKVLVLPTHFKTLNREQLLQIYGEHLCEFELSFDANATLLESHFAFVCSGTATLQAVLLGTPLVLGYKSRALEVMILKRLIKLPFIGLANLFYTALKSGSPKGEVGRDSKSFEIHSELIQDKLDVANLIAAYHAANNPQWREDFAKKASEIRAYLKYGSTQNMRDILCDMLTTKKC